ncbi:ABC transporter permease [Umezawaea sp.]|uniref:ABC transporter permease n=1 Tax=Umezawaea sp. TaxID=1955258 RepID=UPI002ED37DBE
MPRTVLAAFRFQAALAWRTPDTLSVFVTAPLFTVVFLALSQFAGRTDLATHAVLAPCLMSLWAVALFLAGDLIGNERSWGTLEGLVATPVSFPLLVTARITTVTVLGLLTFAESWLVAAGLFGIVLDVAHPLVFGAGMLLSALAMAGTATSLSAVFVLTPSARTVQNTLSYPIYLLSGVMVPISFLPDWVQPLSRLVFLSWSGDLLRTSLDPAPTGNVLPELGAVALLGVAGYLLGAALTRRFVRRARELGNLSHT